jgi:hypothetical protein
MQHTPTRQHPTLTPTTATPKRRIVRTGAMIVGTIYAAGVTAMVGLEPQLVTVTPFWVVSLIVMTAVTATYITGHRSIQTSGQSRRMERWITARRTS